MQLEATQNVYGIKLLIGSTEDGDGAGMRAEHNTCNLGISIFFYYELEGWVAKTP